MSTRGLPLYSLAWLLAVLPFVTTHVSYLMAASAGHVDWCLPYWHSCTSISATGRELPEKLWFKLLMIPSALLAICLWWAAVSWRKALGSTEYVRTLYWLPWIGSFAAFALMLYTLALGEQGSAYRWVRRNGVILAFSCTFLAQLLLTRLIGELARQRQDPWLQKWFNRLLGLNAVLLGVGILSVLLEIVARTTYKDMENAFEWMMALLLNLYFAGLGFIWKRYPARIGLHSEPGRE